MTDQWWKRDVGGYWDESGPLQLIKLKEFGMMPHHKYLDIGCGSLRGGRFVIQYLNPRCYYGLEKEPKLVDAAIKYTVLEDDLNLDDFFLLQNADFDLHECPDFDFMLAHSVFNHCDSETIRKCFNSVVPWLKKDGQLFATYISSEDKEIHMGKTHEWRSNEFKNSTYPFRFYEELANEFHLTIEDLGSGWEARKILKTMRLVRKK